MGLFHIIDNLLVGTKYLGWAIGLIGIVGSVILFFCNLSMGFASAMVFVAALLLSVAVTLLLLPKALIKGKLDSPKRIVVGCVALVLAAAVMGIIYFVSGGFPALNLLFV